SSHNNPSVSSLPRPQSPTTNNPWHSEVDNDQRYESVKRLVSAIFPHPNPAAVVDPTIKALIDYVYKIEKAMYENAASAEEYTHLIEVKHDKMQKEVNEKKEKRIRDAAAARAAMQ
ncbi:hypothetical protein PENTCL1PPCAC_21925, partial [Pristionchus entomophagus]